MVLHTLFSTILNETGMSIKKKTKTNSKKLFNIMPNLKEAKMHLLKCDFRMCFFQYIAFKIFQIDLIFNYCNSCNIQQPSYLRSTVRTKYFQNFQNIRSNVIAFQADRPFNVILHSFSISK